MFQLINMTPFFNWQSQNFWRVKELLPELIEEASGEPNPGVMAME
jgi:hypothetical protein